MLVWFCIRAKLRAHTLRHPCLFMNALLALRPAKPLGVHFRHPCLACPSRCTEPIYPHDHCKRTITPCSHQPFSKPHYPLKSTTFLPPLSKVRCCRPKKFGRLPEGLPPVAPNLSALTTIAKGQQPLAPY